MSIVCDVSFIIPTLDEADNIARLISSIHVTMDGSLSYEIILVDNGSRDNTVEIAESSGVDMVIMCPKITIGALRNLGARRANGKVLVFLDGDICLNGRWGSEFLCVYRQILEIGELVSGSMCNIPTHPSALERLWFDPSKLRQNKQYINSGHLIVGERFFSQIGGFDETLRTGEDVEFCLRAVENSGVIASNPELIAYHLGFPKTIAAFIHREKWHGTGDLQCLKYFIKSKVSLASFIIYFGLPLSLLPTFIGEYIPITLWLILSICICLAAALNRFKLNSRSILIGIGLYFLYFFARFLSIFEVIPQRK